MNSINWLQSERFGAVILFKVIHRQMCKQHFIIRRSINEIQDGLNYKQLLLLIIK